MTRSRIITVRKLIVLIVAAFAGVALVGVVRAVPPTGLPLPSATTTRGAGILAPIPIPSPSDNLPAEKQAVVDRQATRIASAPKITPVHRGPPVSAAVTANPPVTGIRDVQLSPFRGEEAVIENQWHGPVNGVYTVVYAGRLTQTPDQGFVAVSTGSLGQPDFVLKQFPTPTRVGSVHVTGASGTVLTLQSSKGSLFTFDVASPTFK